MNYDELKRYLEDAAENGSLMTPKHDPANLSTTYACYRTVLTYKLAPNLEAFIKSGQYSVNEYENTLSPNTPLYFEIIPDPESGFSVTSSGVTANSIFGSSVLDRLIAVSGRTQGWHVFGEDSYVLSQKIRNGDLIHKGKLR
jgi:hypothetical protein